MTRNMILAVVFSTLIVAIGYFFQLRQQPQTPPLREIEERVSSPVFPASRVIPHGEDPLPRQVVYRNEVMEVQFSSEGGSVESIQLRGFQDGNEPFEMILSDPSRPRLFDLMFEDNFLRSTVMFAVEQYTNEVVFSRDFVIDDHAPFTLIKRYHFQPNEYLFEVEIELRHSVNDYIPFATDEAAYWLYMGPQIGPKFVELNNNRDFRKFVTFRVNNKKKDERLKPGVSTLVEERINWIGLAGKYFALILLPDRAEYDITLLQSEGLERTNHELLLKRPQFRSSGGSDLFRIYAGPKRVQELIQYNERERNMFGLSNIQFDKILEIRFFLGWLENILKAGLQVIYRLVPNYGIAIIILTILVKIVLLPLTFRGQRSMAKMQTLNPQIQDIRTRYKDNPEKMNREMAELYRKEKVNPFGGCLPLLLQFPFFIAMFGLFNNHFDLRGAEFITGWINDLSAPESVYTLPFTIPLLGWTHLRLLPLLFIGSQLLTTFLTPAAGPQQQGAFLLKYGLPVFFFFLLYNMPSGLLVYWIASNILTVLQQKFIPSR